MLKTVSIRYCLGCDRRCHAADLEFDQPAIHEDFRNVPLNR